MLCVLRGGRETEKQGGKIRGAGGAGVRETLAGGPHQRERGDMFLWKSGYKKMDSCRAVACCVVMEKAKHLKCN